MNTHRRYLWLALTALLLIDASAHAQGVLQFRRGYGTMTYTLQPGEPYVDMNAALWIGTTGRSLFLPDSAYYATAFRSGFLKYSDWTLFNSKQPAGTYIVPSDTAAQRAYSNLLYQPVGSYLHPSDSTLYKTKYSADSSLGTKVKYTDSLTVFATPAQLSDTTQLYALMFYDSLAQRVRYSDTASALVSSASKTGFLKYSDWTLFNSKQPALTIGNLSANAPLTQTGGTGAVIGAGVTVSADTTVLATHNYVQNLAAGLFEYDSNGDLAPATATVYDAFFTTDVNGDIEPKP